MGKNLPAMWEAWVPSPGWEEPLEEGVATHCSVLAWRIPADRGAWRAAVRGVTDSRTWLSGQAQHRGRAQETLLSSAAVSSPGVSDSAAPGTAARQASLAFTVLGVCRLTSAESAMPPNHLALCRPLLLLPAIFPNIIISSHQVVKVLEVANTL